MRALLDNHHGAWSTFLARFDGVIWTAIRRSMHRGPIRLTGDDFAEVRASFLLSLLTKKRSKLRAWNPQHGTSLASWIAMLVERGACDYVRATSSRRRHRALDEDTWRALTGAATLTPEDLLEEKRRVDRAMAAVESLPPRQRQLFDLYFEEGLDPVEVADRMGTSLQTVYACRHKVAAHLSRAFQDQDIAA